MLRGFGGGGDGGLNILVGRLLLRSREIAEGTKEGMVVEGEEDEENDKGTGGDGEGDVIEDIDTEGEDNENDDENEEVEGEEYGDAATSSEGRTGVGRLCGRV
jgi:TATA-binding protein-associated factor Taf7